ncbi:HNH endonuclease [Brevibacillus laterosporus]|uniref:HNH endonuclease n=1 Tax=Brevibacillus laterosporus TaxID=1465 RepID=UPI000C789DE9|nr:HNH endonuclease [Brevibacillus laterosporus]AUM63546.1 HNH endonuclease [Brevibacillus laterosporus]
MHLINCEGKVFTKIELIQANNAAIKESRNRQLNEEFLESLPDDALFPICLAADEHNKGEIRVQIIFDAEGTTGFLDLSKKRYDYLPIALVNENNEVKLDYINGKPYPSNRGYTEKVVRKADRDRKFRNNVLSAYGGQCAMCEIEDECSLVAAHIFPVKLCEDDTVNNRICLCANHDKAYEAGTICVKPDGSIVDYSTSIQVKFSQIRLPKNPENHPSQERLKQRLKHSITKRIKKNLNIDDLI